MCGRNVNFVANQETYPRINICMYPCSWRFEIYITNFEWKHKWRTFEVLYSLLIR